MKSPLSHFLFGAFALSAIFLLPGLATAQTPPQFGTNLITNGDAESGEGATNDTLIAIPGWTREGKFQVVPYGTSGGPSLTDPGPKARGKNYFVGGPNNPASGASQSIDVSALSAAFAKGTAKFSLTAYLGGYSSQGDHTVLLASFRNKAGRSLKTVTIGPVTPAQRKNDTGLFPASKMGTIPAGTQTVIIFLKMGRTDGAYNDGSADNLSLIFKK